MTTPPPTSGRRRPGPAPRLSRDLIAEAVLGVGFEEVTVTAVAQRLNATHAALYRHVTDRDDLVRAAIERVADRAPQPLLGPDWEELLRGEAWVRWRIFTEYPGIRQAISGLASPTDPFAARTLPVIRHLVVLGFAPDAAMLAADVVVDMVDESAVTAVDARRLGADAVAEQLRETFPGPDDAELRRIAFEAMVEDQDEWFGAKLDVVLAGIRVTLTPGTAATPKGDA
ncbi:TetR/AcrR family transcriptional regulator [Crossiella sp. CA-258035]|uniref:TetR/AcrR family transcriptional regulator n=1 Tax=Crossiella sp. CA-258035 TaxID=2981138 RepID=UPI0024BC4E0D|nr:TetR/AcrR family transcriptional regulator [Crossiella sp. CA-258035]WHT20722.1 TetR/AcrR family transcriptional regulator [Crossiella sp. CA-258035]